MITDSQAFAEVAAVLPQDQPLTSFSILFARKRAIWTSSSRGSGLKDLPSACRVLILEACAHHRQDDDIGTVKIPALFRQRVRPRRPSISPRELPPALDSHPMTW